MKKDIFERLDLDEYLSEFNSYLAREKPLFLEGDSRVNYEQILELAKFDIELVGNIANLDDALMRISKFAVLHISEIYEFSKIIKYFKYIKTLPFEGSLNNWLLKIEIPDEISKLPTLFDENGEFKDSVDERFYSLKQAYEIKKNEINDTLRKLIYTKSITPYLVDTQIHYINETETLLVRGGFNHVLKGSVVGRSSSGYFYIVPSSISKLKSEQSEILDKKEEIIYEHCKKISLSFNKHLLFLKFINKAFDKLDSLIARAMFARSKDLEFVLADRGDEVVIKDFSHPILKNPKPVSINFSKKVLLITGVNAGGKSMLLKSIVSASILSKYLLPMKINAGKSKIGTFKEFELIMEDEQNAKNDISTFAGRMLSFSKLFGRKNILLGVDEIELGTDFEEAASLYSVMIEHLIKSDVKMIITTHHKRLAMLLAKNSDVELVAALYDENAGLPKFEFLEGVIGKSYAFETALRYGIAPNIVASAKSVYGEDKESLNEAISKAINLEMKLKERLSETEKKEAKLDSLLESLKNQKQKHEDEQIALMKRLELEYYKAIEEAKKGVRLKDTKEKQRSINKANELKTSIKKPKIKPEEFKVGDIVKYGNIKGEIINLTKNEALVLADGLSLRVATKLLKKSSGEIVPKKQSVKISVSKPTSPNFTLDLHGQRVEEALNNLDKFISDSLLMGFDEVVVKHGIGTGKLAAAVKEFLSSHPNVKAFRDGAPNEGGYGSKVVSL
ncbi:MAG: endonuclease MutS2 [Campylobacteraceae bacterium]|mgnify:CR=1 FL=1|nr:endonuclease MutS2 [Campylobacteraceae bacterium]